MTTSLAEGGEGLGTLGLPEPALRDLAAKAGFAQVRHVEMDNPFNSLYELARRLTGPVSTACPMKGPFWLCSPTGCTSRHGPSGPQIWSAAGDKGPGRSCIPRCWPLSSCDRGPIWLGEPFIGGWLLTFRLAVVGEPVGMAGSSQRCR